MATSPYHQVTAQDELETVISLLLMANRDGIKDDTSKPKQVHHLHRFLYAQLLKSVGSFAIAKDRKKQKNKYSSVQSEVNTYTPPKRFEVHEAQVNTPRAGNMSSTNFRLPSIKGTKRKMEAQLSEPLKSFEFPHIASSQEISFRTSFDLLDAAVKQLQLELSSLNANKYNFNGSTKIGNVIHHDCRFAFVICPKWHRLFKGQSSKRQRLTACQIQK
eukprot:CAMPEP_0185253906 /NCGR_PEP_ID=MMETSP1359-20130426/2479_1 /TAXON_ID=552665 /ORGANISM="Bigelowiella longifila, Strain CCMP242" /LENGTH=216 /DNA_ID=CAMNT_0027836357 /DNA_START=26 /DNA_END=676 /DNA_ORIENTATION=-